MRALTIVASVVALASTALWAPRAAAQTCVGMGGCAEGCACGDDACIKRQCGGGPDGESGPSALDLAREMAERQRDFELQYAEAQRMGGARQAEAARRANDRAIAAAKKRNWRLAVSHLEAGLLLDPQNAELARNLSAAREKQIDELRQRQVAVGPMMPASGATAVVIATRIPTELTPRAIDSRAYVDGALAYFRNRVIERARAAANAVVRSLDVETPWGRFLHVELNVATLARDVPDWIMKAARDEMPLEEAANLDLKGGAMVLNVGTAPGRYLQRLVEVRSHTVVILEATERRVTQMIDRGIIALAVRAGAPREIAARALALGKQHSDRIWRWIRPSDRTP